MNSTQEPVGNIMFYYPGIRLSLPPLSLDIPNAVVVGIIFTITSMLSGCSTALFGGYGPKFIGSQYGYSDEKVSENTWRVEYVDHDAAQARIKARQRANEICIGNGYRKAKYEPQFTGNQWRVTARGLATCTNKLAADEAYSEESAIRDRIAEIDAQIDAISSFTTMPDMTISSNLLLDFTSTALTKLGEADNKNKINALQTERDALTAKLKEITESQ